MVKIVDGGTESILSILRVSSAVSRTWRIQNFVILHGGYGRAAERSHFRRAPNVFAG